MHIKVGLSESTGLALKWEMYNSCQLWEGTTQQTTALTTNEMRKLILKPNLSNLGLENGEPHVPRWKQVHEVLQEGRIKKITNQVMF